MVTMNYTPRSEVSQVLNFVWRVSQAAIIIGAINWGLVALNNYNLVEQLFGIATLPTRIVYTVVGLSGVAQLIRFIRFLVDAAPTSTTTTTR